MKVHDWLLLVTSCGNDMMDKGNEAEWPRIRNHLEPHTGNYTQDYVYFISYTGQWLLEAEDWYSSLQRDLYNVLTWSKKNI